MKKKVIYDSLPADFSDTKEVYMEQCNFGHLQEIRFYSYHNIEFVGGSATVAVFRVKLKP